MRGKPVELSQFHRRIKGGYLHSTRKDRKEHLSDYLLYAYKKEVMPLMFDWFNLIIGLAGIAVTLIVAKKSHR